MRADAVRLVVIGLLVVGGFWFLVSVRSILTPFIIGLLLAYLLAPAVTFFERKRLSRRLAVAVVYLAVIAACALLGLWLGPRMFAELARLAENIPAYTAQAQALIARAQARYQFIPPSARQMIEQATANLGGELLGVVRNAVHGGTGLVAGLANFLFSWLLAAYFLADWRELGARCLALLPPAARPLAQEAFADLDRMVGGYFRGLVVVAGLTGLCSGVVALLAGLRYALLFGLLSAVGEFIPYVGPLTAAAAAVIMAWLRSPALALKVALAYLVVQQVIDNVVAPRIVGERLGLHPVAVMFALLAGERLFGLPGMILAAPVAGVIGVALRRGAHWAAGALGRTGEAGIAGAFAETAAAADNEPPSGCSLR